MKVDTACDVRIFFIRSEQLIGLLATSLRYMMGKHLFEPTL